MRPGWEIKLWRSNSSDGEPFTIQKQLFADDSKIGSQMLLPESVLDDDDLRCGPWLKICAADAAAQAAHEHARKRHRGKEVASSARAHALASQGEVRTPAVAAAARPLPISDREREIAMLVVAGWSNREVADRLFVSVRTVEGHLYRIFAKLGIDDRDQLVHLLRLEGSGT